MTIDTRHSAWFYQRFQFPQLVKPLAGDDGDGDGDQAAGDGAKTR